MQRVKLLSVVAAMFLSVGVAYAGLRTSIEVEVETDDAGNVTGAFGNVADAFNSADDIQYIGCGGSNTIGFCQASNAAGDLVAFCFTQDQSLITHIHSITPDSFVRFTINPDSGDCMIVRASHQSFYAPKVPQKHKGRDRGQEH